MPVGGGDFRDLAWFSGVDISVSWLLLVMGGGTIKASRQLAVVEGMPRQGIYIIITITTYIIIIICIILHYCILIDYHRA